MDRVRTFLKGYWVSRFAHYSKYSGIICGTMAVGFLGFSLYVYVGGTHFQGRVTAYKEQSTDSKMLSPVIEYTIDGERGAYIPFYSTSSMPYAIGSQVEMVRKGNWIRMNAFNDLWMPGAAMIGAYFAFNVFGLALYGISRMRRRHCIGAANS